MQWATGIDNIANGARLYVLIDGGTIHQFDTNANVTIPNVDDFSVNATFIHRGIVSLTNRTAFQVTDSGSKLLWIHPWDISIGNLNGAPGDLAGGVTNYFQMGGISASTYRIWGAQFNQDGTRIWMFVRYSNDHYIYMFQTTNWQLPANIDDAQRYSTSKLKEVDGVTDFDSTGDNFGLAISPDETTAIVTDKNNDIMYQYAIGEKDGYTILGDTPIANVDTSNTGSADYMDAFTMTPGGTALYLMTASGNQSGNQVFFDVPLGNGVEAHCDIWDLDRNADHANLKDNGIDPFFYGWTEAGNVNHTFTKPEVTNLCPCGSYANAHYGKDCGITIKAIASGSTASEDDWGGRISPCFNKGHARIPYEPPSTSMHMYVAGESDPYVYLPAYDVHAQDVDGNYYPFADFGSDEFGPNIWMTKNLRTKHRHDGLNTDILEIPGDNVGNLFWQDIPFAAWVEPGWEEGNWEQNNLNKMNYGLLYNGYAAQLPDVCPLGWHVATHFDYKRVEIEWADMDTQELEWVDTPGRGVDDDVDNKLRHSGYRYWDYYGDGVGGFTGDEWNFNTRAAGWRDPFTGHISVLRGTSHVFSPSEEQLSDSNYIYVRNMDAHESYDIGHMVTTMPVRTGASIRCVLNADVNKITNAAGNTEWARGGFAAVPPTYINYLGDYAEATKTEYCKAVGCSSAISTTGTADISSDELTMWQYIGSKWELKTCLPGTGGKCPHPSDPTNSITCGGCNGMSSSDLPAENTCSGPPIY
jgi:uncharacterized protein (TIGR02145 family)